MKDNNQHVFSKKKFGCISGRSAVLILHVMEQWTETREQKFSSDMVYMDYHKAFDTVRTNGWLGNQKVVEMMENYIGVD